MTKTMRPAHRVALRSAAWATLALALVACGPGVPDVGDGAIPFRNPTAPIGVTSRYDDARFAGVWYVRGVLDRNGALTQVERRANAAGGATWLLYRQACAADGAQCPVVAEVWPARVDVPGADVIVDPTGGDDARAVVVWVDDGYRTAAVGDEGGAFAWVLDRSPQGGGDRIKAARAVLEFSGFDLSAMRMGPPW